MTEEDLKEAREFKEQELRERLQRIEKTLDFHSQVITMICFLAVVAAINMIKEFLFG